MAKYIKRGDIHWIELKVRDGSKVLHKKHPGIVVQSNAINIASSVTVVVGASTHKGKEVLPYEVVITDDKCGLKSCLNGACKIKCQHVFSVDVDNEVKGKIGRLSPMDLHKVDDALKMVFGFKQLY